MTGGTCGCGAPGPQQGDTAATGSERCHPAAALAGLPAELRAVALLALDRVTPLLDRVRDPDLPASTSCTACPVCVVLAALRGERSEAAARLADQASELVVVLREALREGAGPPEPAPSRPVQHIHVERVRTC